MEQILRLIEEEVEKRVNKVLEKISQTYDISMRQLLRDVAAMPENTPQTRCLGLTAKKSRCTRPGHHDGYCKVHKDQKPARVPPPPPATTTVTVHPAVQHTHTLPPLFMRGCPACERTSVSPLCI
jgi:hypothetical protein